MHCTNGSPVKRNGQLHMGLWLMTLHLAPIPHAPGHGFVHLWLLQASFCGQSVLTMHSGLQVGGLPKNPLMHEQTAWPFTILHSLLGPQGVGLHRLMGITSDRSKKKIWLGVYIYYSITSNYIFQNYTGYKAKNFSFVTILRSLTTLQRSTLTKCIASHVSRTAAHRHVIDNRANGVQTTGSGTRIHTFVAQTSSIARAVGV